MKKCLIFIFVIFSFLNHDHEIAESAVTQMGWSTDQETIWTSLKDTNHAYYTALAAQAAQTNLSNDYGLRRGMMYLLTGDTTWATSAYNKHWKQQCGRTYVPSGNSCTVQWAGIPAIDQLRDQFLDGSILYSWVAPGLSAQDAANFKDSLNAWCDTALGDNNTPWNEFGVGTNDSDQMLGSYFGCTVFALAILADDATRGNYILTEVGGTAATAVDRTTWRNTIDDYLTKSAGGEWIESSQYNFASDTYLLTGINAINDYYGTNKFPLFSGTDYANAFINGITPDYSDYFRWGDIQEPNSLILFHRVPWILALSGYTKNANALWFGDYYYDLNGSTNTSDRWHYLADPLSTQTAMPATATTHHASGQGVAYHHPSWGATASFFASVFETHPNVDHEWLGLSNFSLFRQSEWSIDNPKGYYGDQENEGGWLNTIIASGGLESTREARGEAAYATGTDYTYHVGTTGGQWDQDGEYDAPDESLHEMTRTHLYLHNADGSDTIVVFDRINADDPRLMPAYKFANFPIVHRNRINDSGAKHQFIIHHVPSSLTVNGDRRTWTSPASETIYWDTFVDSYTTATYDENTQTGNPIYLQCASGGCPSYERKYQTRLMPTQNTGFLTLLNTFHVGSNPTMTEISGTSGESVSGVEIEVGSENKVAIFSAGENANKVPDPTPYCLTQSDCSSVGSYSNHDPNRLANDKKIRYFETSFGVTINLDGNGTIFIADLNPNKTWTCTYGGSSCTGFSVDSSGLAVITTTATGDQQLILTSTNTCDGSDWRGCSTQATCEAQAWYWYNLQCNQTAQQACNSTYWDLCTNQTDCETYSHCWENRGQGLQCYQNCQAASCDVNNCNLCSNQSTCEAAGCYYYNSICNTNPQAGQNVTITLEPTADTYLDGNAPTTNKDTLGIRVKENTDAFAFNSPIRFSLSSIPTGSSIVALIFECTRSGATDWYSNNFLHELTDCTDWIESEATWNKCKSTTNWGTAGAGTVATRNTSTGALATAVVTNLAAGQKITFTSTPAFKTLVQNNIGGNINILFNQEDNDISSHGNKTVPCYDSEYATASDRPKLTIEYTPPASDPSAGGDATKVMAGSCAIGTGSF